MALEQPFDGLERHARRRPGRGVAGGNLPGVGEAGFQRRTRLAFHQFHLETRARQVVGAADTDDTTSKDQYAHVALLPSDACPKSTPCGAHSTSGPTHPAARVVVPAMRS